MKIKFVPQNVECEIKPGQSVLHAAQDAGLYIKSVCKGVPSCAECRVRIVEGDFNVLQPGSAELSLIGTAHFIDRRRLSCQLRCFGDITVDLSEQISKEKKALAKNTRSRAGADELAISRAAASEVSLGAGALREDGASADDLRASGDGLGPDDHGGDDVEGERAAVSAVVGRPVARQPARSAPRPAPRPLCRSICPARCREQLIPHWSRRRIHPFRLSSSIP